MAFSSPAILDEVRFTNSSYISFATSGPGYPLWSGLALLPRPDCREPQAVFKWLAGAFLYRSRTKSLENYVLTVERWYRGRAS